MGLTSDPEAVVALAEGLARRYHAGQVDRVGAPYIDHPRAVAGLLAGCPDTWRAAAWLHDVLEHTGATAADLAAAGVPPEVVRLVGLLSRRPGEDYLDYVGRVCADPAAVRIKLADVVHNMDPARDHGPPPDKRIRYHRALVMLVRALPGDQ
jgi:(p)ppGpp synthase/HD superfamily hydrolase